MKGQNFAKLDKLSQVVFNIDSSIQLESYFKRYLAFQNKIVKNNLNLSIMRAQSVANELVTLGIPVEDIGVHGEGERFPVATNATSAGRAKNRRIVIFMSPKRGMARIDLFNQDERETVQTFEKEKPKDTATQDGKQIDKASKNK